MSAYLLAIVVTTAAVGARWVLDPWLGDDLALVSLFAAVAAAVWYGGWRPALVAAIAGYLACAYLFIEPRDGFGLTETTNVVELLAYAASCCILVGFAEAVRTSQERAEKSRELLQVTFASIGDGVITTDVEGRVTYLNSVAEFLTGWKRDEAAGQPLDVVFRIVNERTGRTVENPATRALREGMVVGLANHTVLFTKDGSQRPIDDSAAPIRDEKGAVAGCVLVFRDITERRKTERTHALLAAIVTSSDDAIVSKTLEGVILSWNAGAERLFGYTPAEAVGQSIDLIVPPELWDEELSILERLRHGERIHQLETTRVTKDGRRVEIALTVSPLRDEAGRVIGASKVARDITTRKRAEQALREADRRKDEFLATLAHELRNPLAPIRNAVQILLRQGPLSPEPQWALEVVDRQVTQMTRLLDDLLDVSRISHNKLQLRKERIELSAVMQNAVETSHPVIESGGHELSVELPSQPVYLDADPVRLAQVLSNLLNNAAKYTDAGGHIRLTGNRQGDDVLLSVKDDGIGMTGEMLPHVFDMFSQEKNGVERSQGGLGIGLSLVRAVVDLHSGSIEARSDGPNRGSEFLIRLPVSAPPDVERPKERCEKREEEGAPKHRLLIADDTRDSADALAMLLRMMGHDVQTAYDGEEAIQAAAQFVPDVVLLDIGMPKMDGYEACRRIRQQPGGSKMLLVALTGWSQEGDRRRTEEAGFDYHMVKPVDPQLLVELLARVPVSK